MNAGGCFLLFMVLVGCGADEEVDSAPPPTMAFETAQVRLVSGADTVRLLVELARSPEQQRMGLMERTRLADTAGMLFVYPTDQPDSAGFWMFRTRIPLDIAFVDSVGIVRAIKNMVPCASDLAQGCPSYPAGVPYRAALEVNAGYFARHQVKVGSRVILADTAQGARAR